MSGVAWLAARKPPFSSDVAHAVQASALDGYNALSCKVDVTYVMEAVSAPAVALPAKRAVQIVASGFHSSERSLHYLVIKHFSLVLKYQAKWVLDSLEVKSDSGAQLKGREAARFLASKGCWPRYPGHSLVEPWDIDQDSPSSCSTLNVVRSSISRVCWNVVSKMHNDGKLESHEQYSPGKLKQAPLSKYVESAFSEFYEETLKTQPRLSKHDNMVVDSETVPETHLQNIDLIHGLGAPKKNYQGDQLAALAGEHQKVMEMSRGDLDDLQAQLADSSSAASSAAGRAKQARGRGARR